MSLVTNISHLLGCCLVIKDLTVLCYRIQCLHGLNFTTEQPGVDASIFTPYSTCSASVSKAAAAGVALTKYSKLLDL